MKHLPSVHYGRGNRIVEQMGGAAEAIGAYTTRPDLGWTAGGDPPGVRRGRLISADRDVVAADVPKLRATWNALAADWESGAIAHVARANHTPVLILRGVSDLVDESGSEFYGNLTAFETGSRKVMQTLLDQLPFWLARWERRERQYRTRSAGDRVTRCGARAADPRERLARRAPGWPARTRRAGPGTEPGKPGALRTGGPR
jgi:hypothetical protein